MAVIIDWKVVQNKNTKKKKTKKELNKTIDKIVWMKASYVWEKEDWYRLFRWVVEKSLWNWKYELSLSSQRITDEPHLPFKKTLKRKEFRVY